MAKVKIKNLKRVTHNLKKVFEDTRKSKQMLDKIGIFVLQRNKFTARTGKSMENNKTAQKLPPLSDFTKALRRAISRTDPSILDSEFFKANKSNVSMTGQLLDKMKYKIKDGSVFIVTAGSRTKIDFKRLYKLARQKFGPKSKDTKILGFAAGQLNDKQARKNDDVYSDLEKRGFGFIGLDEKGQDRVAKMVLDQFRRNIKKYF